MIEDDNEKGTVPPQEKSEPKGFKDKGRKDHPIKALLITILIKKKTVYIFIISDPSNKQLTRPC